MKKFQYALWVSVAVAFVGFIVIALPKKEGAPSSHMPIAGFNKGAHFVLKDHNGKEFNSDVEITDGNYALIFFGFTHCPVICPTELQKFAQIMDDLPADVAAKIQPLFITIDPERDTVDVLKNYVPMFHPSILGLTGAVENVHKALNEWKVFYTKVDDPQYSEYTMDHSTYAYLVDSDMNIKALFRMKNSSDDIVDYLSSMIKS